MAHNLEKEIEQIVANKVADLKRPDLVREPLVAFSSAADPRYPALKAIIGPWHSNPDEILPGAESVVSYFVPFTKAVATEPARVPNAAPLWAETYIRINAYFAEINEAISQHLTAAGYAAATIPATHTYDPKVIECYWSHKSAAHIAGLGSFGANRILITDKGSGGRCCTVVTAAKLKASEAQAQDRCPHGRDGSCGKCIEICPAGALSPGRFEKFVCQDQLGKYGEMNRGVPFLGEADTCGKCIAVCPFAYIP